MSRSSLRRSGMRSSEVE